MMMMMMKGKSLQDVCIQVSMIREGKWLSFLFIVGIRKVVTSANVDLEENEKLRWWIDEMREEKKMDAN